MRRSILLAFSVVVVAGMAKPPGTVATAAAHHQHTTTAATTTTVPTLDDYWNGTAEWQAQHFYSKAAFSQNSNDDWGAGLMIKVGPDGNWYWFTRTSYPPNYADGTPPPVNDCPEASPEVDSTEVRKSTDKGATWSPPYTAVAATPNTAWACSATDGDEFWDGTRWQMLFQCKSHASLPQYGGSFWNVCHLMNDSTDPTQGRWYPTPSTVAGDNPVNGVNPVMGDYFQAAYSSNPTADWTTGNDPWYQVCDTSPVPGTTTPRNPDCVQLEGQTHGVNSPGTPSISTDPSQPGAYMVDVHGIDYPTTVQKGYLYQGVFKTTDWLHFTGVAPGLPNDAMYDPIDSKPWNISSDWSPLTNDWSEANIGGGGGAVFHDPHDGRFYDVVEATTGGYPANAFQNTAAGIGILRTTSLSNATWDQPTTPGRQNPTWYSQQLTLSDEYQPIRLYPGYVSLFQDTDGSTYLLGLRSASEDQSHQGVWLYKLVFNLLKNGDAQRCTSTDPWALDPGTPSTAFTAWRDGNWATSGGCYFASTAPIHQDVAVPSGTTTVTWGGKVAARETVIQGGVATPLTPLTPPGPSAYQSVYPGPQTVQVSVTELGAGGVVLGTSSVDVAVGLNSNEYEAYGAQNAYYTVLPQTLALPSGTTSLRYTAGVVPPLTSTPLPLELLADDMYITPK